MSYTSSGPFPLDRLSKNNFASPTGAILGADGVGKVVFWGTVAPVTGDYPAPGSIWIDTSNALLKYNSGSLASPSWTSVASGATQSLDGAYNNDTGERTVTVDAGSIVFDCSDSSNDYALVINNTSTSGALLAALTIDSEGANSTITSGLLFKTTGTSAVSSVQNRRPGLLPKFPGRLVSMGVMTGARMVAPTVSG